MNTRNTIAHAMAVALGLATLATATPVTGDVRCRVDLDRDILPADQKQTTVIKVSLDAPSPPRQTDRPPVNLAIVMDRSGSMSGSKIEKAREAAIEAVRRLEAQDIFSLVVYDHEVETLVPAQSARFTEQIEGQIRGIQSRGNTALFGGVSQGAAEVRKHLDGPYVNRIILLSDGLANVGPSAPADLARLGKALMKEGISVTTVGVGNDFNEDLMTQLAMTSDGNHYFVETGSDLPRIFAQELGDVLSVVARKVVIEVDCPSDIRPLRIIGREGTIRGQQVRLNMNQLYGGQEKFVLIEVEVPAAVPETRRTLAVARCRYEDAFNQASRESQAEAVVQFSANLSDVAQSVDPVVSRAVFRNEIAVIRDEALDLYNRGDNVQAGEVLREKARQLYTKNLDYGLEELAKESGQLDQQAQSFEEKALSSGAKKKIRAENYLERQQQLAY